MKHLSILVPDDQTTMSTVACIVGAFQVFTEANRAARRNAFKVELVSAVKGAVLTQGMMSVVSHVAIDEVKKTDLVIIPASLVRSYDKATKHNRLLIDWVASQHHAGAEVASMCAGCFMLAATGILEGRICSTHWALSDEFRELYPDVQLQTDRLITDENGIYTNGGAYSFLNLLMYLVEKFYDRSTALHCAKYFQVDMGRDMQAEFSIFSGYKKHTDDLVLDAQQFVERNYQEKMSFEQLSSTLGTSRRNFDRRFIKATGFNPLDYLQRVRVEAAKKQLEATRKTVNEVMYEVGYNDPRAFREVFNRITGLSPLEYKLKYNKENSLLSI
ncbi:helix-turn-helix domain-containing protein [Chitinophaga horti]|uniref:Helix-turn-helix domain-containing protein n=1 Tax=Chitinophaga horti TaxID=2920382 RepID=A0ABY6J5S2_9BACT|nr:helix-turn-helix domain-containing protein [Chitinophaga horti]UYQ94963.1 helix-turn-helix domain-containing protein [Chitinophaga horti]